MTPNWHFNERRPCDRMRNSANDAFFTAESLENLSEALVREAIQNSLDAAQRGSGGLRQVRVRILFVPNAGAEARTVLARHFESARSNFESGLGLPPGTPMFGPETGYIVIEDFGTKGLTGDVNEWRLERAQQNAFFSFFRAEGQSAKMGESLGRWGIGKQVFPTASRLHAMFGITVRTETPNLVMMGSAVLQTHAVGDVDFQPDGWFGCRESTDAPVRPITDSAFITAFASTFGLTRGALPGLSILVPSVDERVETADLRRAVVRSFFWPILLGELVVELDAFGERSVVDSDTLPAHRALLQPAEAAVIELAGWASSAKPAEIVNLPSEAARKPDWRAVGDQLMPESVLDELRERLRLQGRAAVKVPVRVRPKDEGREESMSFFTVYVSPCREAGYRPIFLRDGIVVSDVRAPQMSGIRSLVEIEDPPLAGLLGDAEGVNHTQWQKDSAKFHGRYVHGPEIIKFVTRSVYEIMQRLHSAETKGDPALLLDIFYLPTDEGESEPERKPKSSDPGEVVKPTVPLPPRSPKRFVLQSVKGGFSLKPGKLPLSTLPFRIRVEAGYAVRRGNPIKRWAPDDFNLIRSPLRQDVSTGVMVSRSEGNTLELEIRQAEFQFAVSGFDTKRDLVVRAIEVRGESEANI